MLDVDFEGNPIIFNLRKPVRLKLGLQLVILNGRAANLYVVEETDTCTAFVAFRFEFFLQSSLSLTM